VEHRLLLKGTLVEETRACVSRRTLLPVKAVVVLEPQRLTLQRRTLPRVVLAYRTASQACRPTMVVAVVVAGLFLRRAAVRVALAVAVVAVPTSVLQVLQGHLV
jgi:hypothetical protein